MEGEGQQGTADGAAMMRAAHLFVDDSPAILEDWLALSFIGSAYDEIFRQLADGFRNLPLRAVRAVIVMRSRYAEDQLAEAIDRGVTQYVILSAGFDSFAYRRKDLEPVLQVYEVDMPETQERKRRRLRELGVDIPSNVVFVPVDLESKTLAESLTTSGFSSDEPAFFSWMGATEYLTEKAVYSTLEEVLSVAAPGSEIIFQYFLPDFMVKEEDRPVWEFSKKTCTDHGEPWISFFEPDRLASNLREMGYEEVLDLAARDAFEGYIRGRKDGFCPHNATHLMRARVGTKI